MTRYDPRTIPGDILERRRLFANLWGAFPNHQTSIASYDFMTQSIKLEQVDKATWDAHEIGELSATWRVLPVLMHELGHWWDHIGTTWGMRLIRLQYTALNAVYSNDHTKFHEILPMAHEIHRSMVPTYYTVYSDDWQNAPLSEKWHIEKTVGFRFNSEGRQNLSCPIPFVRFKSKSSSRSCRFPLTELALLEARAIYMEILAKKALQDRMDDAKRALDIKEVEKEYSSVLADPLQMEYLACAHCVVNVLGIEQATEAFKIAAIIAGIALNMLPAHFERLRVPCGMAHLSDHIDSLKQDGSRGFAFLALLYNAMESNCSRDIDAILSASGLPSVKEFRGEVVDALGSDDSILENPDFNFECKRLRELGSTVVQKDDVQRRIGEELLPMPLVLLRDNNGILVGNDSFDYSTEKYMERLKQFTRASQSMFEFKDACVHS